MYGHPSVGSPVCSNKTRLNRLISGNKTLVARPTTYLSVPTTPTRGPRLLAVLCCCTTHQRKEKVKYRSEVVDRRRKRDVGSEVLYVRDPWRGKERGERRAVERERERDGRVEVSGRAHKTRQAKAPPALPSLRAARLPLPATPTTLSVFRRTHQAAQRPPYDGGWLETENKYLSEVPFSTVFLHRTSSSTALISASQQRR